ncbi:MAG: NAD(P)/FAD-dependent oxidoreductase [Clostridia bacterium]|nr:NAD(P)/FAD-dependent oxidoreductase [Clostridia bacterium]
MSNQVLIIGAGAAGLMAAIHASRAGAEVTLLEHNEKAGKKIYITGKGRCNVTNDCTLDEFLREVPRNPRFLYSALNYFSPQDMIALLEENGCPVEVQRGRRAYPASMKASDVTKTLMAICQRHGVRVQLNQEVASIRTELSEEGELPRATGVILRDGTCLPADRVILATGGLSYPSTGSTGDGYRMARELGHTVVPQVPSLIGLESRDPWPKQLQGLSLKNVRVTLRSGKKTLYTELGEMLFTHFGFSGPLILEASCHLPEGDKPYALELDLKPGLTREQLDARLLRELEAGAKKQLKNVLPALLPASLAEIFCPVCGLPEGIPCNQVTTAQREKLLNGLKQLPLNVLGRRPIAEAVVTRGGVNVKEVNPGTMESKRVQGVYFAGEILDVDAHTGGYNLQIAFATGALAGRSSAE